MQWATFGVLIGVAVVVTLVVLAVDRRAGPLRTLLTLAVTFGGAWLATILARLIWQLEIAGVYVIPAALGALVVGLLFHALARRSERRKVE